MNFIYLFFKNTKHYLFIFLIFNLGLNAQNNFTKLDTLRGSITPTRIWWDVNKYTLDIHVNPKIKSIYGNNTIDYTILAPKQILQFELQHPLLIDSVIQNRKKLTYTQKGDSYFVNLIKKQKKNNKEQLTIYYHGQPKIAVNPPWDGGIIWDKDKENHYFIATANQKIGASVWWPCKDHPADEAESMQITVTCPTPLINVSNGKYIGTIINNDNTQSYTWMVTNPINNYGISLNIANYKHFKEIYKGIKGVLDCNYYVLPNNFLKAKVQFKDVSKTLKAFEHWFGPYPFYKDGYKLVEVPYLGMEHQSCIGYGNHYKNGYRGSNMGTSNWAQKFDYIVVHESGHEWFANSISCNDVADLWIHESFTTYAESLFIDYHYGTQAANEYVQGLKSYVKNDSPIIGHHLVHNQGSDDMYFKGSLILHTLRQIVNNDILWRNLFLEMNQKFYHKTVSGAEIIDFINKQTAVDLKQFFYQYLNTTKIPELLLKKEGDFIKYKWNNVVDGFKIPVKIQLNKNTIWITPKINEWQKIKGQLSKFKVDPNFYINY